jgi:hypothetical protein
VRNDSSFSELRKGNNGSVKRLGKVERERERERERELLY